MEDKKLSNQDFYVTDGQRIAVANLLGRMAMELEDRVLNTEDVPDGEDKKTFAAAKDGRILVLQTAITIVEHYRDVPEEDEGE